MSNVGAVVSIVIIVAANWWAWQYTKEKEAHVLSKNEYEYFTKCLESQQPLTQKKIDICQTTAKDLESKGLLR